MIKTIIKKAVKEVVVSNFNMKEDDKRVKQLRKIERAFKRAYNVDTEVIFIDAKYKELVTKPSVNGYHNGGKHHIVVFITNDIRKNAVTLLHELTHAYQKKHMPREFKASRQAMDAGKVSYRNSWHETHARHCADLLILGYIGKIDLRYAMDYAIAA